MNLFSFMSKSRRSRPSNTRAHAKPRGPLGHYAGTYESDLFGRLVFVEVDGTPVESVDDLQRLMVAEVIGQRLEVTVVRNGALVDVVLVAAELAS